MSSPLSYERHVLEPAESFINSHIHSDCEYITQRRLVIEAVAARTGNINYLDLEGFFGNDVPQTALKLAWEISSDLYSILKNLSIPIPLAIASMLQTTFSAVERKRSGSYMTDFRLAMFLMKRLAARLEPDSRVIDPSVGMGAFLVAFALQATNTWGMPIDEFIVDCLYGSDRSEKSIKGSLCAFASLGLDIKTLERLKKNFIVHDSLLSGTTIWDHKIGKFDAIIGNPPWEKLKITRHEYLIEKGVERSYGELYESHHEHLVEQDEYRQQKNKLKKYIETLGDMYSVKGQGDIDLYIFFLELALRLIKTCDGYLSMLVPAGLIRSIGTEMLRRHILDLSNELEITVYHNNKRYFESDTRFKFLALELKTGNIRNPLFRLNIGDSNNSTSFIKNTTPIDRVELRSTHNGFTIIPEVRSNEEWDLFKHILQGNPRLGSNESIWYPKIVREVDMTRDRDNFSRNQGEGLLPLIEGRMIHQYNHSAKAYLSGGGRKAIWKPSNDAGCVFQPQFYYPIDRLPVPIQQRVNKERIGFCDISGQTNERTLMAAPIPSGTICGNKVPTISFDALEEWIPWAFLAYCNSFLVDWFLRRIVTTSLNYFIIKEIPLPNPVIWSYKLKEIARLSKSLACSSHFTNFKNNEKTRLEVAEIRAELEWRVLETYHLDASILQTLFNDFSLLDRSQSPIYQEKRSTITNDLISLRVMENLGGEIIRNNESMTLELLRTRVLSAYEKGAIAFCPSHLYA